MKEKSIQSSVFIATSLDGFIAREDGSVDWLNHLSKNMQHDGGYEAFMHTVDAIVMGRNSYEQVVSFPHWPYKKDVIVLSRSTIDVPEVLQKQGVSCSSESPKALCERLAHNGIKKLYIDGGVTIQRFLQAGAIDELTITMIPILIGSGLPLFGYIDKDIELQHITTSVYDCGFVQVNYKVKKETSE